MIEFKHLRRDSTSSVYEGEDGKIYRPSRSKLGSGIEGSVHEVVHAKTDEKTGIVVKKFRTILNALDIAKEEKGADAFKTLYPNRLYQIAALKHEVRCRGFYPAHSISQHRIFMAKMPGDTMRKVLDRFKENIELRSYIVLAAALEIKRAIEMNVFYPDMHLENVLIQELEKNSSKCGREIDFEANLIDFSDACKYSDRSLYGSEALWMFATLAEALIDYSIQKDQKTRKSITTPAFSEPVVNFFTYLLVLYQHQKPADSFAAPAGELVGIMAMIDRAIDTLRDEIQTRNHIIPSGAWHDAHLKEQQDLILEEMQGCSKNSPRSTPR